MINIYILVILRYFFLYKLFSQKMHLRNGDTFALRDAAAALDGAGSRSGTTAAVTA